MRRDDSNQCLHSSELIFLHGGKREKQRKDFTLKWLILPQVICFPCLFVREGWKKEVPHMLSMQVASSSYCGRHTQDIKTSLWDRVCDNHFHVYRLSLCTHNMDDTLGVRMCAIVTNYYRSTTPVL